MRSTPTLQWFDDSLLRLCKKVPTPRKIVLNKTVAYRFEEQSIFNAILLKTARYISGLNAGYVLLEHGFLQELGALQRMIADQEQDCLFLSLACIYGDQTKDHEDFLAAFWEEEPDYKTFVGEPKNKHEVARKKIQSYISRKFNGGTPDHLEISTAKYLSRVYSGYVHGAATHLIEMYNPILSKFEVSGSSSIDLLKDHHHDFENYLFRGVILMRVVAQVFDDEELANEATNLHRQLLPEYATSCQA